MRPHSFIIDYQYQFRLLRPYTMPHLGLTCISFGFFFQKDQKLPTRNWQARMGQFLISSYEHYSLVENVSHLSTRYISPQFHLFFESLFDMVIFTRYDEIVFNGIFNDLFELNRDWYVKYENDDTNKLIYQPPPKEDVYLNKQGCRDQRKKSENYRRR